MKTILFILGTLLVGLIAAIGIGGLIDRALHGSVVALIILLGVCYGSVSCICDDK
jgi:lipoprotein signal peptidase